MTPGGRFLGIDFGTKRIGLAVSDETGRLAFPKSILENNENIFGKMGDLIRKEKINGIVIGESENFKGEPNKVAEEIKNFVVELRGRFDLPVDTQKEFLTSVEARRYSNPGQKVDASAAALILQRYLDKINK